MSLLIALYRIPPENIDILRAPNIFISMSMYLRFTLRPNANLFRWCDAYPLFKTFITVCKTSLYLITIIVWWYGCLPVKHHFGNWKLCRSKRQFVPIYNKSDHHNLQRYARECTRHQNVGNFKSYHKFINVSRKATVYRYLRARAAQLTFKRNAARLYCSGEK